MKKNAVLKICLIAVISIISFFLANESYAVPVGSYEVADFSSYDRGLALGSGIDAGDVTTIGGFNVLQLSGDNEYVKTIGDIKGFTYQSDWSWMTIVKSDQLAGYRVFMRGKAWADKAGDFDLRLDAGSNSMYTWHGVKLVLSPYGGYVMPWVNSTATSTDINNSDLVWLAGTYDYSDQTSRLYVNGAKVGEYDISPMDDRNNTNPLNINGQWDGNANGEGNVYGEGNFSIAQLILSQSLFSDSDLLSVYNDGGYMASDSDTWLDFRVKSAAPVPVPATMLLLGSGLIGLAGFKRKIRRRRQ